METLYAVNSLTGEFVGTFIGAELPIGCVSVPSAPDDARQIWNFDTQEWGPVPVTVPQEITALDGLLTLDAAGLSSAYQTWASSPDRTFVERAFIDKAMTWKRQDPTILAAADALGLTSEQVDELFIQAGAL